MLKDSSVDIYEGQESVHSLTLAFIHINVLWDSKPMTLAASCFPRKLLHYEYARLTLCFHQRLNYKT